MGLNSVSVAKKNPYVLCEEIEGVGFERADAMAIGLGLTLNSSERVMSGVVYTMSVNERRNGHICLPREKLAAAAAQLLGVSETDTDSAVSELLKLGKIKYSIFDGVNYVYLSDTYKEEVLIAERLVLLDKLCPSMDVFRYRQTD